MEKPYCIVDGKEYQLEYVNEVLRFPNTKPSCENLNRLHMDYVMNKITLDDVWDEYTQTGSSFDLVEGYFSKWGMNNHTVTNGNGRFKKFELHSGNSNSDEYYSDDNIGLEQKLSNLSENYDYYTLEEKIEIMSSCLNEFKEELKNVSNKLGGIK